MTLIHKKHRLKSAIVLATAKEMSATKTKSSRQGKDARKASERNAGFEGFLKMADSGSSSSINTFCQDVGSSNPSSLVSLNKIGRQQQQLTSQHSKDPAAAAGAVKRSQDGSAPQLALGTGHVQGRHSSCHAYTYQAVSATAAGGSPCARVPVVAVGVRGLHQGTRQSATSASAVVNDLEGLPGAAAENVRPYRSPLIHRNLSVKVNGKRVMDK
jgi:hypothetical protein